MTIDAKALNEHVVGCAAAHQLLLAAVDSLTDEQCRQDSLLPKWSRGHVLSHLARNADSHVHLLAAAGRGEIAEQYDGGYKGRVAAIEDSSGRSAIELVADVRRSIYALEGAWAGASPTTWAGEGLNSAGATIHMSEIVFLRWREVEVHHADLALAFSWQQWSETYVRLELDRQIMLWRSRKPMGMTDVPDAALALPPRHRLAWLIGRVQVDGVAQPDPF